MNHEGEISPQYRALTSHVGMWVFLTTEAMMFGTLIAAYIVLRFGSPAWPAEGVPNLPILLTLMNTFILLSSSVFMHLAERHVRKGNLGGLRLHLAITAVLGAFFLAIQAYEWTRLIHEGLNLKTGAYGSTFFTITGFHGLHVSIGVLVLLFLLIQALRKRYTPSHYTPFKIGSMYWHFVDGVWIVIFASLYLV